MQSYAFRLSRPSSVSYKDQRDNVPRSRESGAIDLRVFLDSHSRTKSLRLSEMSFGDEGANLLGEFLEKNKQVEALELRGNNLSSEGFTSICEGLFGNNNIKTLSAEWNNIGSGTRGIETLADFVAQNNSLEYLDLRNNKLNTSAAPAIENIIRASPSLVTLDLRWNEVGNHGAKTILEALDSNSKIQNIELGGNNITQDVLEQIASRLDQNRQRKGASNPSKTREFERPTMNSNTTYFKTQRVEASRDNREMFEDLQKAISANTELERMLHVEARKNAELKEKFYREMDLSNRELQTKIDQLLRENATIQSTMKTMEADNVRLNKENTVLQDKVANLDSMHLQDLHTIEDCQQKIRVLDQDLRGIDTNYKTTIGRMTNEHVLKATEMENSWDLRLKEVMRENEYLSERNKDLERELQRINDENRQIVFTTDDRVRESSLRARDEERQKNVAIINEIEFKLRTTEEELYRLKRQLEDTETEFERRKDYADDKLRQANEEIRRLKNEVTINVEYFNKEKLKGESLQNEVMVRDNTLIKLESDIRELQKVINNKEIMYQEQIDILRKEHDDDSTRADETKITLQKSLADVQKQNRQLQSDLNRIRTDMQRASELLVNNLSQTVYKTFTELK